MDGTYLCQHFAFLLLTQLFVCECSFRLNPILPSINVAIWGMAHQLRLAGEKWREANKFKNLQISDLIGSGNFKLDWQSL